MDEISFETDIRPFINNLNAALRWAHYNTRSFCGLFNTLSNEIADTVWDLLTLSKYLRHMHYRLTILKIV